MALRFQQKLLIPTPAHTVVERKALLDQLEQAIVLKRVVTIAAPAGWGKTTTLAQWARGASLPIAWYTLDGGDRDPHLFLDYLLRSVAPFVPSAAALGAQLSNTSPKLLPDLFREAALAVAAVPEPFALVLDDFHLLEDDLSSALPGTALIFSFIMSLIDYAHLCHLVLSTRALPDLHGMVRVIAQQRAAMFDYGALQFSAADVQCLASMTTGVMLSDANADRLTAQLGGWVTGLVLSLGQMTRAHGQPSLDVEADTTQVYAFLAEQTIAPLPAKLRRFLEDTSVLEDLSPQHCDTLRGTRDSAAMLDEIVRRSLFVSRRGGWLAYHSLFREFLRTRLARDRQRERKLLRRAGDLYRDEDNLEQAVSCYLAAQDLDAAFDVMRITIPRFRQLSRQNTLSTCFTAISGYFKQRNQSRILPPDLLLAQARVYSDLALWERAYLSVQLAGTIGELESQWEAHILEADLAQMQGDHVRAQTALTSVSVAGLPPRLQLFYHLTAGRVQIATGAIDPAITSLEQAHQIAPSVAEAADDPSTLAHIYDNLGWAYAIRGNRQAALRHLQRADACWQACGNSGRRTMTLNNLGTLAMEEGRSDEARAAFETGLALAQQTARRREEIILRYSIAELAISEGQIERALEGFAEAHTLAVRMDVQLGILSAAVGALWAAALLGEQRATQAWQQTLATLTEPQQPDVIGRKLLAQSLLLMRKPQPDPAALAALIAEATNVEQALFAPERAYLALLRVTLAYIESGWTAAATLWDAFEASAAGLPDSLLTCFIPPHRDLFRAAGHRSTLAQRLIALAQQPTSTRWQITALGGFACYLDGALCTLSPLHRALLVRLLDAGPQGLPVERLWEAVWGESVLSTAALHQALRRLRIYTQIDVVVRDGFCAIQSPWDAIDYDVSRIEQTLDAPLTRESMQRATALYRGDFLLSAPLNATFWADARRAYLQQRYLAALEQFARTIEAEAPELAIHYYQQALQIDGCREQTAMQLMRLAARFGNRSLVYTTFEQLTKSLHTLGVAPDSTTTALYQQLR
jgi:ATP/maltotriose-dependent transcriptional regulator MalT/DNA-binding SARP family transcriptional activator